ncbi:MAG: SAM-dependent methyltransferase, partial [Clostridia bacterium]|nr:SAM-dependent methyltransferase [Clostridia bacterium]
LSDRIALRISDGLQSVSADEAEDITMCGMGGTLMTRILSGCVWLQKEDLHLILQPQSHVWEVRSFLFQNGFCIEREEILKDAGKLYITISAYFTGEQQQSDHGRCYFGQLLSKDDTLTTEYVQSLLHHLQVRYDALCKCGVNNEETEFLSACLTYYNMQVNSN